MPEDDSDKIYSYLKTIPLELADGKISNTDKECYIDRQSRGDIYCKGIVQSVSLFKELFGFDNQSYTSVCTFDKSSKSSVISIIGRQGKPIIEPMKVDFPLDKGSKTGDKCLIPRPDRAKIFASGVIGGFKILLDDIGISTTINEDDMSIQGETIKVKCAYTDTEEDFDPAKKIDAFIVMKRKKPTF